MDTSVAEPVEPNLVETWSWSRNYLINKYLLQSVRRMLGRRKSNFYVYSIGMVLLLSKIFKCPYMAGAGAGAEIRDKGGAGVAAENK